MLKKLANKNKHKVAILFGGMSTEHDVSIQSAYNVIYNIMKLKDYEPIPVVISRNGEWYLYHGAIKKDDMIKWFDNAEQITNIESFLRHIDKVFPVLHGLYGEDGTVQGMLDMMKVPYVGSGVLSSALAMDKVYAKMIFEQVGIRQAKYVYLKNDLEGKTIMLNKDFTCVNEQREWMQHIEQNIGYPCFVKPSNSGSSIGINKVLSKEELLPAILEALKYDDKILVEEEIKGREIECAVLENDKLQASILGEVPKNGSFYSYDAKYKEGCLEPIIPADLDLVLVKEIQEIALRAFKALDCRHFARVDFFVVDNLIYINEINTLPGFTAQSMYPKLWEASGIPYEELIGKLLS
ncbi:MAG: D-alanine--D-alanine ligase [Clostridia bacterium]|nr:D-alanine--D-alanine ligase [Clostridia bacterium]